MHGLWVGYYLMMPLWVKLEMVFPRPALVVAAFLEGILD